MNRNQQKQAPISKGRAAKRKPGVPYTAQQTIPYQQMYRDGICRVDDRLYTKCIEFEDITYQLAHPDDQAAVFDGYCALLNSFDSTLPFQLSFINRRSRPDNRCQGNIPLHSDAFDDLPQQQRHGADTACHLRRTGRECPGRPATSGTDGG